MQRVTELLAKAKALTEGFQPGHSRYQIDNFIVGKQGTVYAQWQQTRREIHARLSEAEKQDQNATREIEILVALAESLKAQLGPMTPEREAELEAEAWTWRARRKLAIDLVVYGRPSESTMEFILQLPTAQRMPLLEIVKSGGAKALELESWLSRGAPALEA